MPRNIRDQRLIAKDWYVYPSTQLGLGATSTGDDSINIQADSDFILHKLSFTAFVTNTFDGITDSTRVLPPVTLQVTDQGSGRQLFQEPVMIGGVFGTGDLPFILPAPRRFASNSVISLNYINLGAVSYDLYLNLIGVKVYVGR